MAATYKSTERTRVRRMPKRGVYDREIVHRIIDEAIVCHVGVSVDGKPRVIDGPFPEAKEFLGSFTIVDVDSLDRALEIAARNPASRHWGIEVRPLTHEAKVTR